MPVGVFGPQFGFPSTANGATQITAAISAVTNYGPPPGAVAFLLQTDSAINTDVVRWRVGAAANVTLGQQLEAGRDSGVVPYGSTLSLCPVSATQVIQLTWFTVT